MGNVSFEGIENRVGEIITYMINTGKKQIKYKQRLVGTDSEHLIFEEGKGRAYVSKKRIVEYN